MKKRLVIGMLTAIVSLSLVGCAPKQIKDSVSIAAGEALRIDAEDYYESAAPERYDTTQEVLISTVEHVSKTTAELKFDEEPKEDGDYTASVVVTDEYGNSAEKSIGVAVDTTAPVINGVKDETVSAEPTVDSLHYTAEDSRDGEVSVETSIEKTDDSEYTVTAVAKDEAGNEAKETATLTLVEEKKTTSNESKSTGKSNSASQSNSQAEAQPAQEAAAEAPAAQPEVQPGEVDTSNAVTTDQVLAPGETLTPDNWICSWCNVDCISYDGYVEHMKTVHNMQ